MLLRSASQHSNSVHLRGASGLSNGSASQLQPTYFVQTYTKLNTLSCLLNPRESSAMFWHQGRPNEATASLIKRSSSLPPNVLRSTSAPCRTRARTARGHRRQTRTRRHRRRGRLHHRGHWRHDCGTADDIGCGACRTVRSGCERMDGRGIPRARAGREASWSDTAVCSGTEPKR